MEIIFQTVFDVLKATAGVLIFFSSRIVYQIWRTCSRYHAVETYSLHLSLARRTALRLELYRRGDRRPKAVNSPTTPWHILVVPPEEAEDIIRMHCNYLLRHEGRMSVFVAEAGIDLRDFNSKVRNLFEDFDLKNLNDCKLSNRRLEGLQDLMKAVKSYHEMEHSRITGENYLTMLISKTFMWHRRLNGNPTA